MRFVLVKGQSQYGSLRLHVDQLAEALAGLGQHAVVIDLTASDAGPQLAQAAAAPIDCLFGFNGVGSDLAVPGTFFQRPAFVYASLYVDHPAHHAERLSAAIERHAVFFLDRSHVAFAGLWANPGAFAHIGFLPPGANTLDAPVDASDAAFAARDIPLLFTGTYRGPPAAPWADWPESPARTLAIETSRRMAADGRLPLLEALRATLAASGGAVTPALLRSAAPLLSAIQFHAEAHHRHVVLTALGEAGAPLAVYGLGWEPICARHPSFRYGGVGSFEETLALLRRARLVLNINNGFVAGGHERVFTAMCAGAAVFSDESAYYAEAFSVGEEIATYDLARPDQIGARLNGLLADPAAQARIARAGFQRAMADHRWTNRAQDLVRVIQSLR
jgi:glycosyltransferase involved in cell wall biosynthesis